MCLSRQGIVVFYSEKQPVFVVRTLSLLWGNTMQKLIVCFCFLSLCTVFSPFTTFAGSVAGFPEVRGPLLKKISYTDTLGTHTVILTQTEVFSTTPNSSDPDFICGNQEINAYGYLSSMENAKPSLSWRMHDLVHDCEASASCEFAGVSPQVTDLDGNGVSEVWLVYYIGCRGDVSPIGMKILMYENGKKYAMRGETFVHADGMDLGGRYKADEAFASSAPVFRQYADQLWQKWKNQ